MKRDAEGVEGFAGSQPTKRRKLLQRGLGRSPPPPPTANVFAHYVHNFVHACFSAFWNLDGKANKTDSIRPLLPATGLEGHAPPSSAHAIKA